MITLLLAVVAILALFSLWVRNIDRAVNEPPASAQSLMQKRWTDTEIKDAYNRAQTSPIDVKPYLLPKRNRRYIVAGGSGLVGGWIVHHLLMRGEDPRAIRIVDLSATKRQEALDAKIDCVLTDVSDQEAVNRAFRKPWPEAVKNWPLTVFHTVAYINASDRKPDFLPIYLKVNIGGTKCVLNAAKAAGATCFIATSSGSVALVPPSYYAIPRPRDVYQVHPNADRKNLRDPPNRFGACYSWSKAQAEVMVTEANDPQSGFRTGIIRPGHGIYGHGIANESSLTWNYLRRGGTPSWISNVLAHFVSSQNVSIGHLAYEDAILSGKHDGGKAYCVTDPNPPIRYGDLYRLLELLAHPSTPVKFDNVSPFLLITLSHIIEGYHLLQNRYLSFLPKLTGDLYFLQPAVSNLSAVHIFYSDVKAQQEIGYKAPIGTLDGFALAVADWNDNIEESKKSYIGKATTGAEVLAK